LKIDGGVVARDRPYVTTVEAQKFKVTRSRNASAARML